VCLAEIGKTDEALNGGSPFVYLVWAWREVQKYLNPCHGLCRRGWHGWEHRTRRRSTPGRARRSFITSVPSWLMFANWQMWWWWWRSVSNWKLLHGDPALRSPETASNVGERVMPILRWSRCTPPRAVVGRRRYILGCCGGWVLGRSSMNYIIMMTVLTRMSWKLTGCDVAGPVARLSIVAGVLGTRTTCASCTARPNHSARTGCAACGRLGRWLGRGRSLRGSTLLLRRHRRR
jgi:hypothetical protein